MDTSEQKKLPLTLSDIALQKKYLGKFIFVLYKL